jgi:TetR/AcrR family transcriptional regulator
MSILGSVGELPARRSRMPADDRHRQLLEVAIDVFSRNGFSGTKTKDIATAAGVSEAILFRHFATKEDLYHAILDMHADNDVGRQNQQLQELMDARDDLGVFRFMAAGVFKSFGAKPAFHRLMMYALLEGHLLANLFRERFVLPTSQLFSSYIAQRQKEGAFRPCDPIGAGMFAIGSMVHFAMTRHVFGLERPPHGDEAMLEELAGLILAALSAPEVADPRSRSQKGTHARS